MKVFNIRLLSIGLLTLAAMITSCEKDDKNIFNMFKDVTVDFHNVNEYSVVGYKEVKEGDSVYINFTINSPNSELYSIYLLETGGDSFSPLQRIDIKDDSQRHTYTGVFKMVAVSATSATGNIKKAGTTTFRLCGVDRGGIYVGDGYKVTTVNVLPGYDFYTDRTISTQDSVGKNSKLFFSLANKKSYTYDEASKISSDIDFGLYGVWEQQPPPSTTYLRKLYLFSPAANPLNAMYPTSSWTQKGTLFSEPVATSAYTAVNSATKLRVDATAGNRVYKAAPTTAFSVGQCYYFKTPAGKYGLVYFAKMSYNHLDFSNIVTMKEVYENFSINVKIEK